MTAQGLSPRPRSWRLFALSVVVVAVASIGLLVWIELRIGGDQVTTAVDDSAEGVAAAIAALSCGLASYRAAGRLRLAWGLLAASAASWCAGEIVWTLYEVGLGQDVPFPSVADVGYLAAIPLAVAGILSFSHAPRGTSVGIRLWLDRAIIFLALAFVGWELGLNSVFQQSADTPIHGAIALAYPLGDIVIATVLLLAIRRSTDEHQGRLFLLLGGLAANAAADSAFAYLTASGAYGSIGSVVDIGWVTGYLMIALAALWPSVAGDKAAEEKPIDIWQLALPWFAILAAGITALVQAARGHPLDTFGTVAAGVLAVLLMLSQVLAHNESLGLLIRSRLSAATLNDIIVYAPLGMLRIGTDLSILQANPSIAAMLRTTVGDLTGARVDRFFSDTEMARESERFRALGGQEGVTADFDIEATRADGTTTWLHETATTVGKAGGGVDYYLVMLEDVSARRAAEQVAAANLEVLERLNRVKSQFLTKVSHEFRTALVGIQGFSEYIREADALEVDEVKEFANDIYNDAQHLNQTLSEMLELDRDESSRAERHLTEVDLGALISEAAASLQMGTANHAINLDLETLPAVSADAELISQVITSLIGRAIDYSPMGAPILVTARGVDDGVRVSVRDSGRASASDLEAQLLGRGNAAVSRGQVRTLASNVGLPMARQIIEMHGGRIWFDATAGTVWSFTLPAVAKGAPPALAPAAAS